MNQRPLSPHLGVYKFMYTMSLSILHRITGCRSSGRVPPVRVVAHGPGFGTHRLCLSDERVGFATRQTTARGLHVLLRLSLLQRHPSPRVGYGPRSRARAGAPQRGSGGGRSVAADCGGCLVRLPRIRPRDWNKPMSLRTPLSKVIGRGSAGEGVGHWWVQRVTAVALLPLTAWFVIVAAWPVAAIVRRDARVVRPAMGRGAARSCWYSRSPGTPSSACRWSSKTTCTPRVRRPLCSCSPPSCISVRRLPASSRSWCWPYLEK